MLVVRFRLRIKEQEEVGWLVGRGLARRLSGAQCIQRVDSGLSIRAGPCAGIGHQNGDYLPPHWSKILTVNDVAVIEGRHKHTGVRGHFPEFCQHRAKVGLVGVHGAGAGHAHVLRNRQARLGTLHRDRGMRLKCFRNKSEQAQQSLSQCGGEGVIGIRVIAKERRDHIQLQSVLSGSSRRIDGRSVPHGANGTLEFICIHRCHLSVMVKIVKWFVDTIEILEICEHQ